MKVSASKFNPFMYNETHYVHHFSFIFLTSEGAGCFVSPHIYEYQVVPYCVTSLKQKKTLQICFNVKASRTYTKHPVTVIVIVISFQLGTHKVVTENKKKEIILFFFPFWSSAFQVAV